MQLRMKTLKIFIYAMILLICVSCEEALDLNPAQSLSTAEALVDIDGMRTALYGAYDGLQSVNYYGRNYLVIPEIQANLVYLSINNSNRFVNNYIYQWNSAEGTFTSFWNLAYAVILRVNNVINNIDDLVGDAAVKNDIKAQALTIRALAHFDLVRLFAKQPTNGNPASDLGVPIMLEAAISEPARNTVAEVYAQVLSDLNAARNLLPDKRLDRFSKDAVDALLARVNLYSGNWAAAESAANAVISSGRYTLARNVIEMFEAPGSSEEIFTLRVLASETNGADNMGGIYNPDVYGDIRVASDLIEKYEADDTRLSHLYIHTNNQIYQSKYLSQDGIAGLHSPKILRLAEVLLIRAEARFRQGNTAGALNDINDLRASRSASMLESLSFSTILDERHRELAFEGHAWFDYIRNGIDIVRKQCNTGIELALGNCSLSANDVLTVMPIPRREMDVNQNMVQNPGYN